MTKRKQWTPEEAEDLRRMWPNAMPDELNMRFAGRPWKSLAAKAKRIGVKRNIRIVQQRGPQPHRSPRAIMVRGRTCGHSFTVRTSSKMYDGIKFYCADCDCFRVCELAAEASVGERRCIGYENNECITILSRYTPLDEEMCGACRMKRTANYLSRCRELYLNEQAGMIEATVKRAPE